MLGPELVLSGDGDCCGSDRICPRKKYSRNFCDVPVLCKFSNFAIVQVRRGRTPLNAVSRIRSFFD